MGGGVDCVKRPFHVRSRPTQSPLRQRRTEERGTASVYYVYIYLWPEELV